MDPFSASASTLTMLSAAEGTCKALYNLILELNDAPQSIRCQNKKLQHLHENITSLLQLCDELPKETQLVTHLDGIRDFVQDVNRIKLDIEKRSQALDRGKGTRVKEICKWLLFDRYLKQFFHNLEHYNMIFSHALSAAQL
jgi:hypothetical protein